MKALTRWIATRHAYLLSFFRNRPRPVVDPFELLADNYDVLFQGRYDVGHKQYVGPRKPVVCRFCDKGLPDVSFHNDAHAIPELLGNRQLVVTDECDACNSLFAASIEDHLGKFTKPYRLLGQVRGKKGIPSYKTPQRLSRIEVQATQGIVIEQHAGDSITEFVDGANQLRVKFVIERHSPSAVYKALVKIALSLMPADELKNFSHAKKWIRHRDHTKPLMAPLMLLFYFVPGPTPFKGTSVMLLRRKVTFRFEELPYCMLVLAFGNLQYQLMVPALADDRKKGAQVDVQIPRFPSAFGKDWPFGAPKPATIDLTHGELTEPKEFVLTLQYESVAEGGPRPN